METEFVLSAGDQRWPLPPGATTITIGRASNADIRLQADDQISRIHARLTRDAGTWILHDESRNGTGLNGHRLTTPTPLSPGDRIHIGRSILTFHTTPKADPPSAPERMPAERGHTSPDAEPRYPAPPTPPPYATPSYADPASALPHAEAPADEAAPYTLAEEAASYAPVDGVASYGPADAPALADPLGDDVYAAVPDLHSSTEAPPAGPSTGSHRAPTDSAAAPAAPPGAPASHRAPTYPPNADPAQPPAPAPTSHRAAAPTQPPATTPPLPDGLPPSTAPAEYHPGPPFTDQPHPATPFPPDHTTPPHPTIPTDHSIPTDDGYPADDAGLSPFAPDGLAAAGGSAPRTDGYPPSDGGRSPFAPEGPPDGVGSGDAAAGNPAGSAGLFAPEGGGGYVGREDGPVGLVPGFEGRGGGTWAAYPSADNPEPVRSPWEVSGQIEQSAPNWNESDSWPAATDRRTGDDRRGAGTDQQPTDQHSDLHPDQDSGQHPDQPSDQHPGQHADQHADFPDADHEAVGTVRLSRVLIVSGGIVVLGLVVNLIAGFFAAGPGSMLGWLVAPSIALVTGMVLALIDAAAPKPHRPGRFDVSVLIAIGVVLVGIGVGGFALTAGTEYVSGYLTGNESGADRLVKPVAKAGSGISVTVENVTYTSHFTRIEVQVGNSGKQAFTIPIDGTTFTAADGTALHADPGKSSWPSRIDAGGSDHGTITFKGHLPDSATQAVLTFKSGTTTFAVSGVLLSK
ncbi:putative component of type VI protein secretion system [Kribbella aluminosa]|uniref:Component of type VI protein secretion system n=1 Tax=Kribbella aluminosa TaxID=416017 RepID=A0ABS4UVB5_9ACTN|nr:FHA domain-containing protein [Kribbella aluminosa]MBP2355561.1 putative component of type VI protein secretion system [Kribbella aluminosa]